MYRPLPKKLVARLKRIAPHLLAERLRAKDPKPVGSRLARMRNVDHRLEKKIDPPYPETKWRYYRVQEMDLSRNHPGLRVVIKHHHGGGTPGIATTASDLIRTTRGDVHWHNRTFRNETRYKVLMPHAHAIHDELIAMAWIGAPTCNEVIDQETKRGRTMFAKLGRKSETRPQLDEIATLAADRLRTDTENLMLIDYARGKFVFMPLVDYG